MLAKISGTVKPPPHRRRLDHETPPSPASHTSFSAADGLANALDDAAVQSLAALPRLSALNLAGNALQLSACVCASVRMRACLVC